MKVLFISPNSPFQSIGGIERYITNLIAYYKTHLQSESALFLMLPTDKKNYVEKDGNVTIYYNNNLSLSRSILIAKKQVSQKAQDFSEGVKQIIKKESIDIICAE